MGTSALYYVWQRKLKRYSPGEEGQWPVLLLVPKDLGHVLAEAQREAVLIGAGPEDRRSERL